MIVRVSGWSTVQPLYDCEGLVGVQSRLSMIVTVSGWSTVQPLYDC